MKSIGEKQARKALGHSVSLPSAMHANLSSIVYRCRNTIEYTFIYPFIYNFVCMHVSLGRLFSLG